MFHKFTLLRQVVGTRLVLLFAVGVSTSHCAGGPLVTLSASQQKVVDRGEPVDFEGDEVMLRLGRTASKVCVDPGHGAEPHSVSCLQAPGWSRAPTPDKEQVYCCDGPIAWRIHYNAAAKSGGFQGVLYEVVEEKTNDPFYFSVFVPEPDSNGNPVATACPPPTAAPTAAVAP
jgi:hypothetical protein